MAISESVLQGGILSLLFPTPSSLESIESQKKAGDLQGLCLQTVGSVRPEEGALVVRWAIVLVGGGCGGLKVARLKRTWI